MRHGDRCPLCVYVYAECVGSRPRIESKKEGETLRDYFSSVATSRMSLSLLPVRTSSSPPSVACRASKKADGATGNAKKKGGDYQEAWFKSTRATLDAQSTTEGRRRVIREYVEANRKANGGREREDLYTGNWDGAFRRSSVVGCRSSVVGCRLSRLNSSRDVRRPLPLSLTHTHSALRSFGIQETSTRGTLSTC